MEDKQKNLNSQTRQIFILVVLPSIIVVAAVAVYLYLHYKETHISTDDAFVDGRVHVIASKVSGTVKALRVTDNQLVEQGKLLLEIDPIDYEVRAREAGANLEV